MAPQRETKSAVPLPCAAGAALPDRCESVTLFFFVVKVSMKGVKTLPSMQMPSP